MKQKSYKIGIFSGDGIGPEIMKEALKVLKVVEQRCAVTFELIEAPFGAAAYFDYGHPFPEQSRAVCDVVDAVLKGPVGLVHSEAIKIPVDMQPERGAVLPLRAHYNTYANFRPVVLPQSLAHLSPLKAEVIGEGIDIIMVRELLGGLYFGKKVVGKDSNGVRYVEETLRYDEIQIRQVLISAFDLAMGRKRVLHNIHKSNILQSSVLWNEVLDEVAQNYPEVKVIHMLVDAAATHLCLKPTQFDVMVMENMFGDILSDQGGGLIGSLGLMPSACIGDGKAYYEPSHGSAPDIAGQNIANPYSMIGSVAMMLEHSLDMSLEAKNIWAAMQGVFSDGYTTPDLATNKSGDKASDKVIGTDAFGDRVVEKLKAM
ncbi:MAG: 3-isopropylmalate dehydrogenase [Porticoccaceae bacterium]